MKNERSDGLHVLEPNKKFQNRQINGSFEGEKRVRIDVGNDGGGGDMGSGDYVTHKELELTKEAIENKLDSVESRIVGSLNVIDTKLANHEEKINNVDKKINWLVGLAILSIGIPIFMKLFFP